MKISYLNFAEGTDSTIIGGKIAAVVVVIIALTPWYNPPPTRFGVFSAAGFWLLLFSLLFPVFGDWQRKSESEQS